METAPNNPQNLSEQSPHILHPGLEETDPTVTSEQVAELAESLEKGQEYKPKFFERIVLRKKNWLNAKVMQRARALAAAAMVGLGAATAPPALAGVKIQGGEKMLADVLGAVINNSELGRRVPANVIITPDGNINLTGKSPQQIAYNFRLNYQGDSKALLDAIGINVREDGAMVLIENKSNANQSESFTKYHNDRHFTYDVKVERTDNNAVLFVISYIEDGRRRTEYLKVGTKEEVTKDGVKIRNMWKDSKKSQ